MTHPADTPPPGPLQPPIDPPIHAPIGAPIGAPVIEPAGDATLVLRDVRFGYRADKPIIDSLSARLEPHRLTVLLGPNAAGKSTLLKLMLGQASPWSGQVLLNDRRVASIDARKRAALISFVPQRAAVSFAFSVEQVVAMGRFAQPPAPEAIEHAILDCDLDAIRTQIFSQLSAGQQQRVLLARAMAQAGSTGRIMLLDEPGSAMDLWHVHQMMHRLVALAQRGMAVLVVLHDLNLAARYADTVWLVHEGRMVANGSWEQVLTPERLEPVYRVRVRPMRGDHPRPVFSIEPADTLLTSPRPGATA